MSNNSFKIKNGLTLTPIDPSEITNPIAGDVICDITDNNKVKRWDEVASAWVQMGGSQIRTQNGLASDMSVLEVPNNQATSIGNEGFLLETGNKNLLTNPGFEHQVITTGWTLSCTNDAIGIATPDSSAGRPAHFGSKTLNLEIMGMDTGGTCVFYQDVETGGSFDYMHSIWAKADIAGKAKVMFRKNEAFVTSNAQDVRPDWVEYKFQQVSGSTHSGIGIEVVIGIGETVNVALDEAVVGYNDPVVLIDEMTDWESVPCSSTWTTNSTTACKIKRVGDSALITWKVSLTGPPNATSLFVNMPTGLRVDLTKLNSGWLSAVYGGGGTAFDTSANNTVHVMTGGSSATNLAVRIFNGSPSNSPDVNATSPFAFASGDYVTISALVPIEGWTSKFKAITAVTEDPNTIGHIEWASMNPNPPEGYISAINKTIGKTSGDFTGNAYKALYDILWNLDGLGTNQSNKGFNLSAAKGASAQADWDAGKTIKIDLQDVFPRTVGTIATSAGAYAEDTFQGHRHNTTSAGGGTYNAYGDQSLNKLVGGTAPTFASGGPVSDGVNGTPRTGSETAPKHVAGHTYIRYRAESKVILGSFKEFDYVYVEANSSANSAIGTSYTDIVFENEVVDTVNGYNPLTGVFKVPQGKGGLYRYISEINTEAVNLPAGHRFMCSVFVNGTIRKTGRRSLGVNGLANHSSGVNALIHLSEGDEVKTQCTSNAATAKIGAADGVYLSISRIPGQFK